MTSLELHQAKHELLNEIFELAENPLADPEETKAHVEALFQKLGELTVGKEND